MHRNGKEFAEALFSLARESGQELAYGDGLRYVYLHSCGFCRGGKGGMAAAWQSGTAYPMER